MRTVSVKDSVKSFTQDVLFGFCVQENDEEWDSWKELQCMDEAELQTVALRLKISPEFLRDLGIYLKNQRDAIHRDLADIWGKLQ